MKLQAARGDAKSLLSVLLWTIVLLLCLFDGARRLHLSSSMSEFLPEGQERFVYRAAKGLIESKLAAQMILTAQSATASPAEVSRRLEEELQGVKGVSVRAAVPPGMQEAFYQLYFPRRFAFASLNPTLLEPPTAEQAEASAQRAALELKNALAGPEGMMLRNLAPQDPFLLFPQLLERFSSARPFSLEVEDGRYQSADGWAVLFLSLRESSLDLDAQEQVLKEVQAAINRSEAALGAPLQVEMSGANRYGVRTRAVMQKDLRFISIVSSVVLLALFAFFIRSVREIFVLLLPLLSGFIVGGWAVLFCFSELHYLTLAFGTSLLGVAIDYPLHFLVHRRFHPELSVRRLFPTLALAAMTTVAGMAAMATTSFPGLREMAVFSAVGLSAALVSTFVYGNAWGGGAGNLRANHLAKLGAWLQAKVARLARFRRPVLAGCFACLVLVAALLPRVQIDRNLDSLSPLPEDLVAEDLKVRERLGTGKDSSFVLTVAPSRELALQRNEQVYRLLLAEEQQANLEGFASMAPFLFSQELQRENQQGWLAQGPFLAQLRAGFEAEGLLPSYFELLKSEQSWQQAVQAEPLTLEQLQASPLASLLEASLLEIEGQQVILTHLKGLRDKEALQKALSPIDGAYYFSQRELMNQIFADLQGRMVYLLGVGLGLILVVVLLRYRALRPALAAVLPSALACGLLLAGFAYFQVPLNLLHILGLVLVCSMGVDYGIFMADAEKEGTSAPAMVSILIGMLTTVAAIGGLAFSHTPALSSIGVVTALGVLLAFVFAPLLSAALLRQGSVLEPARREDEPSEER